MTTVLERRDVERFRAVLTEHLGLQFDDTRLDTLADVLRQRAGAHGGGSRRYLERFGADAAAEQELRVIAQALTVSETYFFRNMDQFRAFAEVALPERLAARPPDEPVRVLCAGCASGEEPYSIAIIVREHAPEAAARVRVRGVDVNPAVLAKAREGRYTAWSLRETPPALRARWFAHDAKGVVLAPAVRDAVELGEANLVRDDPDLWAPESLDIVFCRNVLMYFAPDQARAVVARIARALVPDGYLFLGHAETLRGLSNDFHLCHTHDTFYYRRRDGVATDAAPPPDAFVPAPPPDAAAFAAAGIAAGADAWLTVVENAASRIAALADAGRDAGCDATRVGSRAADLYDARELVRSERYLQAIELLGTLPAEEAREPEALLLRAVALSHGGSFAAAERVCVELLARDELNAGAHYVLALCREAAGDASGAADHDAVALYLDPTFAMARLHLGLLARRRRDNEAARRELSQALLLLRREDPSRLVLFGGGFGRDALVALCAAELAACGGSA